MARYIIQLRRGWKYNSDPETGEPRDDWAKYTAENPDEAIPKPGELVLEYDNGIPRLKIGDGINEFSALPYMSVDSFILPTPASITLLADGWQSILDDITGEKIENRYYQPVTVNNAIVTPNSKIDLQPSPEQLAIFAQKDITFTAINRGGSVRVCLVGQKPTQDYTIQATITEVAEYA